MSKRILSLFLMSGVVIALTGGNAVLAVDKPDCWTVREDCVKFKDCSKLLSPNARSACTVGLASMSIEKSCAEGCKLDKGIDYCTGSCDQPPLTPLTPAAPPLPCGRMQQSCRTSSEGCGAFKAPEAVQLCNTLTSNWDKACWEGCKKAQAQGHCTGEPCWDIRFE
jgi:hypothetical protein